MTDVDYCNYTGPWVAPEAKLRWTHPMTAYDPNNSNHGVLLINWFIHLTATHQLHNLLTNSAHSIQGFLRVFEDRQLAFWHDERGIWMAFWTAPCLGGVFFSLWVREDMRRTRLAYQCLMDAYEAVFRHWPVVLGLTRQKHLLKAHTRLGYTVEGLVPKLWDGWDAWLVVLTKENFYGYRSAAARRKIAQHVSE